ncbi:PRKAG [Lepeophtheirus salmonis]|uniref:PRKAG n=1 Tax=Lepeophtheirus salmonis TaxID=72036 RepID=A0A7R8CGH1_LEPSM|nr:PRKAG [Lepeophtheirus salmonis]CAF2816192.1 PRKAG [Lepeophtheirus salmonis]
MCCAFLHTKRLLRFLFIYIYTLPKPQFLAKSVFELNIGTYENIETARPSTRIIEALHKFVNKKISALPIVNNDGKLVDIYAKIDVINLAAEKTYENLDISLEEANEYRNGWFEGVHKCKQTDSLFDVMKNIVKAEVHRLVVVDDDDKVMWIELEGIPNVHKVVYGILIDDNDLENHIKRKLKYGDVR